MFSSENSARPGDKALSSDDPVLSGAFPGARVYVLHPHPNTLNHIVRELRANGFWVSASSDPTDLTEVFKGPAPHVVIVAATIGGESGPRRVAEVLPSIHGTKVVAIVPRGAMRMAIEAMRGGAADVVTEPIDSEALFQSVRSLLAPSIRVDHRKRAAIQGFAELTPKERQVLELLTHGLSNKEAAIEMRISPRTVEVHRSRIMEKVGARNAMDLMRRLLST